VATPLSVNDGTYGTGVVHDANPAAVVAEVFDFRPAAIVETLQLKRPNGWSYQQTAAYGHFGRDIFPWEKTDRIDDLRKAAGVN
jgi:S-adenosylmethionine synthetase